MYHQASKSCDRSVNPGLWSMNVLNKSRLAKWWISFFLSDCQMIWTPLYLKRVLLSRWIVAPAGIHCIWKYLYQRMHEARNTHHRATTVDLSTLILLSHFTHLAMTAKDLTILFELADRSYSWLVRALLWVPVMSCLKYRYRLHLNINKYCHVPWVVNFWPSDFYNFFD